MRYRAPDVKSAGLGILALAMTGAVAAAQEAAKAALPDTISCPESIAAIATCYGAKHETGAYLLAAMPKNWNNNLIVFAHGGPDTAPPTATRSEADLNKYAVAIKRGFAWIATTYRRAGYGIAMAVEDSDNARKFFIARIAVNVCVEGSYKLAAETAALKTLSPPASSTVLSLRVVAVSPETAVTSPLDKVVYELPDRLKISALLSGLPVAPIPPAISA